jgi:hypothetical protein
MVFLNNLKRMLDIAVIDTYIYPRTNYQTKTS